MVRILISVSRSHATKLDSLVEELVRKGFILKEALPAINILVGECPESAIEKLERVAGVSMIVEDQKSFRLLDAKRKRVELSGNKEPSKRLCADLGGPFDHTDDFIDEHTSQLIAECSRYDSSDEDAHPNRRGARHENREFAATAHIHDSLFGKRHKF